MYWINKAGEPFRSILLFEMPVIFYISGASVFIANRHKSLWSTIKNRFKRILVPYYWYAAACLILAVILMIYNQTLDHINIKTVYRLITAQNSPLPIPFMFHLWFIIPYLIVACLFPINKKISDRFNRWTYLTIYFILLLLTQPLWEIHSCRALSIIRESVYYNFFFMAGYLTYKRTTRRQSFIIMLIAASVLTAFMSQTLMPDAPFSMQNHKFPPDCLFVSYGILMICLFSIILSNIVIPYNKMLDYWNKNGYTLYLWQNFSFCILALLYSKLSLGFLTQYPIIDFIMAAILIFLFSYAVSFVVIKTKEIIGAFIRARGIH